MYRVCIRVAIFCTTPFSKLMIKWNDYFTFQQQWNPLRNGSIPVYTAIVFIPCNDFTLLHLHSRILTPVLYTNHLVSFLERLLCTPIEQTEFFISAKFWNIQKMELQHEASWALTPRRSRKAAWNSPRVMYVQYSGGYSVRRRDIIITVEGYRKVEGFQYWLYCTDDIPPQYWVSSIVLMISLHCTDNIPPLYWISSTVLMISHRTPLRIVSQHTVERSWACLSLRLLSKPAFRAVFQASKQIGLLQWTTLAFKLGC